MRPFYLLVFQLMALLVGALASLSASALNKDGYTFFTFLNYVSFARYYRKYLVLNGSRNMWYHIEAHSIVPMLKAPTYNGVCSCMWGPLTWERLSALICGTTYYGCRSKQVFTVYSKCIQYLNDTTKTRSEQQKSE